MHPRSERDLSTVVGGTGSPAKPRQNLAPATVFIGGVRRSVIAGEALPDLLEDQARNGARGRAEYQPDRLVCDLAG
jgi:hypothetical protein